MASRREPARRKEGVGGSVTISAHLGFRSQLDSPGLQGGEEGTPLPESFVDQAPSGADATEAFAYDNPKSIDHGNVPQMYKRYTALGAAVTSSGGPIQVLLIWFAPLVNHRLTFDSLHH